MIELTDGWELGSAEPGGAPETWQPAVVPGTVAEVVPDADLLGRDWWYRCRFGRPSWGHETVLHLDGLATHCTVLLNGQEVARTANMHRTWAVPVDVRLDNELVLVFRALSAELSGRRPRPRWKTALVADQKLRFVRTSLIGHISAWTPPTPTVGPRGAVRITHAREPELGIEAWAVGTTGFVRVVGPADAQAELQVGEARFRFRGLPGIAELPNVALWEPHGSGQPTLHPWAVTFMSGPAVRHELPAEGQVGFRSVSLEGTQLRVNGRPVFCRGAAWAELPADEDVTPVLETARDAGVNMIRLVGTATYGSTAFFETCDRLGILVWQDLPFANFDYPLEDPDFAAEVEAELEDALGRLARHASLAVLCGGSEVEQQAAMLGLPRETWQATDQLAEGCARYAPGVPFVPSSPTVGPLPFSTRHGFTHYWGVGAYRRPLTEVRRAGVRFASECLGFSNVPAPDATPRVPPHHPDWKAGVPRDAGTGWDFEDVRDHYLRELFGLDPVALRSIDVPGYLARSRVVTGELLLRTFAEWRRPGSGCSGGLVWFLKDLVPGAGWGVLDVRGEPKPAWWYLKRAWARRAVLMTDEGLDGVDLHVLNETAEPLAGRVVLSTWRRGRKVVEGELELELGPGEARTLCGDAMLGSFQDLACAYGFGPPKHDAVVAQLWVGDALVHQDVLFPGGLELPLLEVGLEGEAVRDGDDVVVTLRSERLL